MKFLGRKKNFDFFHIFHVGMDFRHIWLGNRTINYSRSGFAENPCPHEKCEKNRKCFFSAQELHFGPLTPKLYVRSSYATHLILCTKICSENAPDHFEMHKNRTFQRSQQQFSKFRKLKRQIFSTLLENHFVFSHFKKPQMF